MASSGFCSGVAFCAVLLLSLQFASRSLLEQFLFQPSFPVHDPAVAEGAVFITGCSSGIGRQTALELIDLGQVVFCTVRKQQDVHALVAAASQQSMMHALLCDVTNETQITEARDYVLKWLESSSGQPRNLIGIVNNAGRNTPPTLMEEESTIQNFDSVIETNVRGPLLTYQAFLPLLRRGNPMGRIINVGSLAGKAARPFRGPYTVSKFALEGFTDTIRQELMLEHISVSMVNPGYVKTAMFDKGDKMFEAKLASGDLDTYSEVQRGMFDAFRAKIKVAGDAGGNVTEVSSDILHALFDPRPKTRYYPGKVGMGPITASFMAKLFPFLPDRGVDKIVVKTTKNQQ